MALSPSHKPPASAQCTEVKGTSLILCIGYFLLGDSLNTTVTVIGTLQNQIVAYNFLELTYLLIVGIAAQAVGIFAFWNIQKRYQLPTKTMFNAVAVGIILLDGWGMIGIWTQRFGFHNKWEVWVRETHLRAETFSDSVCLQVYQVFYGLFVCPWYSYSQTVRFMFPSTSTAPPVHLPATNGASTSPENNIFPTVVCSYPLSKHLAINAPPRQG